MRQFWRDILLLMQAAPPSSPLHDVARLEYVVKSSMVPQDLEDAEQKVRTGGPQQKKTVSFVMHLVTMHDFCAQES